MKIKLFIVEDKGATPTHFGFMSFGEIETYTDLPIALKLNDVFDQPFFKGDKERIVPLNTLPHTMVDANGFYGATLSLPFMVLSQA